MTSKQAHDTAAVLGHGATPVQTGGNLWVVRIDRADGTLVVISDDGVGEYASEEAFFDGNETTFVGFTS